MRKLIIKVIDHNGVDIDKSFFIGDGDELPNLHEEVEGMIEVLETDFDSGLKK